MTNRKIYHLDKAGSLKNLHLKDDTLDEPGEYEVTVDVRAIGINYADIFCIKGLYKAAPKKDLIPGLEFAGIVYKAGSKVTDWQEGDFLMGVTRFGGYADYLNIDVGHIVPLPLNWTFEEGAGFLVQALTAYYSLVFLGDLQQNQTVLIHSAAGGVGTQAIRIAKKWNAFTIGTVGNSEKVEYCYQEGYNQVLVRNKGWNEQLKNILKDRPLDLVLECIGGKVFSQSYELLKPMGRLVTYGAAQFGNAGNRPNYLKLIYKYFTRPKLDPMQMTTENKSVMAFNLIFLYEQVDLMEQLVKELNSLSLDKPFIGNHYAFEQLPDAIRLLQAGQTKGKVVVYLEKTKS